MYTAAAAKSPQSCPTLCDPIDSSPPGSLVPGILQARTLEWVAVSFCNAWKWKVKGKSLSRVWLVVTPWTAAHQVPPSKGFSRQEYWSGVPLPSLMLCINIDKLAEVSHQNPHGRQGGGERCSVQQQLILVFLVWFKALQKAGSCYFICLCMSRVQFNAQHICRCSTDNHLMNECI